LIGKFLAQPRADFGRFFCAEKRISVINSFERRSAMIATVLLDVEPKTRDAVEAAFRAAGHRVLAMANRAEALGEIRRQRYDVLFISDREADDSGTEIAVAAEARGVRAVIMTKDSRQLKQLRAKGLICFKQPKSIEDLRQAIRSRI
jgi:DNA-binding NtrC family response regulator